MRYSVDTEYIFPGRTPEEGIRLIAEAGFDAVDFSFTWDPYVLETGHGENWYRQIRKVAEDNGVSFNQAHAPFASSFTDPEKTAARFREIVRAMCHAGILGVDTVIVHPMQHLHYADAGVPEQLFEMEKITGAPQYGIGHAKIFQNFANHLRYGTPLIATGEDGLAAVQLANAAQLSGWKHQELDFPCDAGEYDRFLQQRILEENVSVLLK